MNAADPRVLLEKLQSSLERVQVDRRVCTNGQPIFNKGLFEPLVSLDFYGAKFPFNDPKGDDAVNHGLIGKDRARVDVTVVDVIQGQSPSKRFQVFAGESPVLVWSGHLGKLLWGENRASCHNDFPDEHTLEQEIFSRGRRKRRWKERHGLKRRGRKLFFKEIRTPVSGATRGVDTGKNLLSKGGSGCQQNRENCNKDPRSET